MDKAYLDIQAQIEKGVTILRGGGIVAYPTDTVYGLGASAVLPQAVERVYTIKERPRTMPFPLLVANVEQIISLAEAVSPLAWRLIEKFLPGALTLVLSKSSTAPGAVTGAGGTIAVRIPAHPVPLALIEGLGAPLVGTSANISGQPSPLTADGVRSQLADRVDLIIDGGRCPGGRESTVVDVTGETPVILREGAISRAEIELVLRGITSGKEAA